jgi:3-oxoacyl-[acyl-carrier protein] reductase
VGGRSVEVHDLDGRAPYGHVCRPEDVAEVVAFLVSEGGGYVNGQRIAVDGGKPGYMAAPARARAGANARS